MHRKRPYDPDNHDAWSGCARRRSPASPPTFPSSRSTIPTGTRSCSCSAGAARTGHPGGGSRAREGFSVAHAHLHYLNPFPRNTGEVLSRYERVLVPEMNLGQLLKLIRAEFLVDAVGYNRVRGVP